jgi:hypothetical protein
VVLALLRTPDVFFQVVLALLRTPDVFFQAFENFAASCFLSAVRLSSTAPATSISLLTWTRRRRQNSGVRRTGERHWCLLLAFPSRSHQCGCCQNHTLQNGHNKLRFAFAEQPQQTTQNSCVSWQIAQNSHSKLTSVAVAVVSCCAAGLLRASVVPRRMR